MIRFSILIICMLFYSHVYPQATNLYVSPKGNKGDDGLSATNPLSSLKEALDLVSVIKKRGNLNAPINIFLAGSTYNIEEPVKITHENGGEPGFPLTIKPLDGQQVIFNGARKIEGWKQYKNGIWMASIAEVKDGKWNFNQLFVNGQPKVLARFPNQGYYIVEGFPDGGKEVDYHTDSKRFQFKEGDINSSWKNMSDIRVIVYHFWSDAHLQIDSINTKKHIVIFKYPAEKRFTDDFSGDGAKYIVENVFEGLDSPGEWFLDRKKGIVYYIPEKGENMNTSEVLAPVTAGYINFEGDVHSKMVENVNVENITFQYSNFILPEGDQNDMQACFSIPASITAKGAGNITIKGCSFLNLGNFAFDIKAGCRDLNIIQNKLEHIGAGAFKVNGGTEKDHPLERTKNIVIADNEIGYYGDVYPSAVGILLMNAEGCYVGHNHIHHGWYSGISVGWHWGYERSISRDNIIEYNYIHHIGQGLLSDMGAIYTLGISPGTIIRNNLIHDVESNKYGGWGIYNDEGSSHILIENNIVYNTKYAAYNMHYGREITVRNNIFALARLEVLNRTKGEPHTSLYFENNIVYWNTLKDPYSADWSDQKYTLHVNPWKKEQPVKTTNFDCDYNIYFHPGMAVDSILFNGDSWEKWHKRGKDIHSIYADPMFKDPSKFDFSLDEQSPAFKMGFKPIDMKNVGPRITSKN